MSNILIDTDSYKFSHFLQYPPRTTSMFSYLESRGGEFPDTVFFGLQYILNEYLSKPITKEDVKEAAAFAKAHGLPFPIEGFNYIVDQLGGKWPVRIRAVPEGTVVPTHNVLMTVESTDPKCFWVVGYLETMLMRVWYPTTVATLSREAKKVIYGFLKDTSATPDAEISFKLHDFGSRGVSSLESAAIGGAAHLVNFMGSDTVPGVVMANRVYKSEMAAFSVPAAEHSTITSWGKEHEADAYRNMLKQFAKPGSLVAIVSDSYDLYAACEQLWGGELKQQVIDSGATVIIRPDSGVPEQVVLKTAEILASKFGYTTNSKGYKVLNNVRIIQGDGINLESIYDILTVLKNNGYSATNIAFGMGGALLQKVNRDTLNFAFKCSSIVVDGKRRDVFKAPATGGWKKSKKGVLSLRKNSTNNYATLNDLELATGNYSDYSDCMVTVYENGKTFNETTLDEIRTRAKV